MSKTFREKLLYILLGIGIGLVISSSLIIVKSTKQHSEYSDEDIIQRARELGMVFIKEAVKVEDEDKAKIDDEVENEEEIQTKDGDEIGNEDEEEIQTKEDEKDNTSLESGSIEEYIDFEIEKGESTESISKRLFEEGLIDDTKKFNIYISEKGLEKKILYGNYKVKKGSTYDELIKLFSQVN